MEAGVDDGLTPPEVTRRLLGAVEEKHPGLRLAVGAGLREAPWLFARGLPGVQRRPCRHAARDREASHRTRSRHRAAWLFRFERSESARGGWRRRGESELVERVPPHSLASGARLLLHAHGRVGEDTSAVESHRDGRRSAGLHLEALRPAAHRTPRSTGQYWESGLRRACHHPATA